MEEGINEFTVSAAAQNQLRLLGFAVATLQMSLLS
jgi:hypothetical protein